MASSVPASVAPLSTGVPESTGMLTGAHIPPALSAVMLLQNKPSWQSRLTSHQSPTPCLQPDRPSAKAKAKPTKEINGLTVEESWICM
jgi:hypothetical protein